MHWIICSNNLSIDLGFLFWDLCIEMCKWYRSYNPFSRFIVKWSVEWCAYLLVFPVMPGDGAVSCLSLDGLTVRTHQHTSHQTQGSIACGGGGGRRGGGEIENSKISDDNLPFTQLRSIYKGLCFIKLILEFKSYHSFHVEWQGPSTSFCFILDSNINLLTV